MVNERLFDNGRARYVCAGTVLQALGIDPEHYHYTWNGRENVWVRVLRRHGFAVRSRTSRIKAGRTTVGQARKVIRKLINTAFDPPNTVYAVVIPGHVLLLGNDGQTLVDTAPRKRDRRQVVRLYAIWRKS
jgi:hypothetical protein